MNKRKEKRAQIKNIYYNEYSGKDLRNCGVTGQSHPSGLIFWTCRPVWRQGFAIYRYVNGTLELTAVLCLISGCQTPLPAAHKFHHDVQKYHRRFLEGFGELWALLSWKTLQDSQNYFGNYNNFQPLNLCRWCKLKQKVIILWFSGMFQPTISWLFIKFVNKIYDEIWKWWKF